MSRAEFSPALKAEDGDLPEGWQHEQLDGLSELVRDQIQPSAAAGLPYVGLEHIDPGEPTLNRWGDPEDVRSAKTRFASGDILYGKLRPYLDKSVLAPFAGICSTDILVLRAQADRAIAGFLVSAIHTKTFLQHAISTTAGVNHPRTSWNALKVHALAVPTLPEQRAIAGVLRTVQQAKEACEQVLAATRQLKQSLLHHLFTYGPVPLADAARVPLKETEIGEVPESWRPTTLGLVADIGYGIQAAVAHLKDSSKGIPILTNVNITRTGDIDLTTLRYYEVPQAKRDRFILKKGDVLFNWRSGSQEHVGKTALFMLDGEYTHSSFILRMRCSDAIRPQFLAKYLHWLRSRRYFARTRQQSSVNSVFNKSLSETIPILLPPLELQDEIARQLSAVDTKLAAEVSRRAALAALFQSLLHHLMTGQVRLPEFARNLA
jgi:type I restriction enzyme S subunit